MGLDAARDKQRDAERKAEITNPLTGEPLESDALNKTVGELFDKGRTEDLFVNYYLENQNPKMAADIMLKHRSGKQLTDKEDKWLVTAGLKFNLLRATTESMKEALAGDETLDMIAQADPRIERIIAKHGKEKTAKLLVSKLDEKTAEDPKLLKQLIDNVKAAQEIANGPRARSADQVARWTLSTYNIPEDKYFEAAASSLTLKTGVTPETRKAFEKMVQENLSGLALVKDFFGFGTKEIRKRADQLEKRLETQRNLLHERDKHLAKVGSLMRGTLDPDINLAMQKALFEGGEIVHEDKRDLKTTADVERVAKSYEGDELKEEWKKSMVKDPTMQALFARYKNKLSRIPQADRDAFSERFATEMVARQKKHSGGGILLAVLKFLLPKKSDIKKQSEDIWKKVK